MLPLPSSLIFFSLIPTIFTAIIPLPNPPNPIPEPPTVDVSIPLTVAAANEKHAPTALEITSSADHLPLEENVHQSKSHNRLRVHSPNSKFSKNVEIRNKKCNNEGLQQIMMDAISTSLAASKMLISERATRVFAAPFDVICARGHFSYYVEASTYCEVTSMDVTCFAYKSSSGSED